MIKCKECSSSNTVKINTYKRFWYFCKDCGSAHPQQKSFYPLSFLPVKHYKNSADSEASMYDYFTAQVHIDYSKETADEFIRDYVEPWGIEIKGKKILDVSGGNGHFLKKFQDMGAEVSITEINQPTIDYIKKEHDMDVYLYDFNKHRINEVTQEKYDIVMLRAAIMFCKDLKQLAEDLRDILNPGGIVIINHSVIPTLGVINRVQLDEFSYFALRHPDAVVKTFETNNYETLNRKDETDPSLYVYDHDLKFSWRFTHYLYQWIGLHALRKARVFGFPARDRRRSTMMFKLK